MPTLNERFLIYSALLILCGTIIVLVDRSAGLWSFVQIAVVIELMCWIGTRSGASKRSWTIK